MKCVLILLTVAVFNAAQGHDFFPFRHGLPPAGPPHRSARTPVWGTIVQKLNHFDANDQRTWNMRYIYNNQFYRSGGPIFIMVGAEWTIDEGWLQSGQMFDMAREHGGYMFYTEHRFYGKSYPTNDLSPTSLQYLTTDLALADVAYFIQYMKQIMPALKDAKVVIVGGSYGGNMAIWLREKYPNLVHAAVSSSAPVFAKVDFYEYHDVVAKALGPTCSSVISRAVDQIKQLMQSSSGIAQVQRDYNICNPVSPSSPHDYYYFFLYLAANTGAKIQYANSQTVNEICSILLNTNLGSEYYRLAKLTQTQYCKSSYKNLVDSMSSWDLNRGDSRQWTYQTCTQYGYFQTSPNMNSLYRDTIPVAHYNKWCSDIYGSQFTPQVTQAGVDRTNSYYGGYNPNVTRVISVHGTTDPWHSIGLHGSVNNNAPTIIVNGTSHCADLGSISLYDPAELKQAKQLELDWVRYWLQYE